MMSNAELDNKMNEADKKRKKTKLTEKEKQNLQDKVLKILNKKAPLIKWEVVEEPKDFNNYIQEANRKVKDNNIYIKGSFIHPEKGELAAISAIPTGLELTDELAEDVAQGFENDRRKKLKFTHMKIIKSDTLT